MGDINDYGCDFSGAVSCDWYEGHSMPDISYTEVSRSAKNFYQLYIVQSHKRARVPRKNNISMKKNIL